jgi:hypothetical protein
MKIKTLKDFKICEGCADECYTQNNGDFENACCNKKDLRQSAFQDLKLIIKEYDEVTNDTYLYQERRQKISYLSGQIMYIKWKFNITEEELIR